MRSLFITTKTSDCDNHVKAWKSVYGETAHRTFDHMGLRNDWMFLDWAREIEPDVIFYIGANQAPGNPKPDTLRALRAFAPMVLLCSDAADTPWHPVLNQYRKQGCFDLLVSIDGSRTPYVDLATLTPIAPEPFTRSDVPRDICCGFSGTVGRWNIRSETINALEWLGGLTVREREPQDGYNEHAAFMRRCKMILNTSWTGSGQSHHIKGRVLEAGWAGCALLEYAESPIAEWFPSDCYFIWRDAKEAATIIKDASDEEISHRAERLAHEVRTRYSAKSIYEEILKRINVHIAQPVTAS